MGLNLNKPSHLLLPLSAGERFRIENGETLAIVRRGKIEVYAVTRDKGSFRQQFLAELSEGGAAFPALDEFETVDTLIYAEEDSEIEIIPFDAINISELQKLMREWFAHLVKLSWMTLLADKGDEQVIAWRDGTVLNGTENSLEELLAEFRDNEEIFSMLLGVRFHADDKRFTRRVEVRARNQRRMMDNSVANLLGEEETPFSEGVEVSRSNQLEEVTFIVQRAAMALNMPTDNIKIAAELTNSSDSSSYAKGKYADAVNFS